jgi:uncharacterized protein
MAPVIEQNLSKIQELCMQYGMQKMFVFGSAARGSDFKADSDIDLLYKLKKEVLDVPLDERPDFFEMLFGFEEILGRKVDLIDLTTVVNPYFIQSVNQSKQKIYEA